MDNFDVFRFIEAHRLSYQSALTEIRSGRKISHWMWYIFPQIQGLCRSSISQYYAIQSLSEAAAFLKDPYLGNNLVETCQLLLSLKTNNATEVFGRPDHIKLKSSMTLFSLVPETNTVFQYVLKNISVVSVITEH